MFARKVVTSDLLHLIGKTGASYDNEVTMIQKFSDLGGHRNIVPILRQGWIEEDRTYFFDMECCPMTLDAFIYYEISSVIGIVHFLRLTTLSRLFPQAFSFWGIVRDVTAGLKFIHSLNAIHRDLKPKNGISNYLRGRLI